MDTPRHEDETPPTRKLASRAESSLSAVPLLLPGRRVAHFRIDELLARGGMGVLYRAEDTRLGRAVALKFLAPELVRHPVANTRFLNEARAASALEHPNLCTLLDVGETEEGLFFLAMPLYEGESLDRRLARGPLPVAEALDIVTQAARGLAKAHQHGIVHRDIKPANLFLTVDGVVKVLDFGIAKLAGEAGPTREGLLPGTPSFMAPEQTRGNQVDARTDVWALGVVLYQILCGRRPFEGGGDTAVLYNVRHVEPEPLSHLCPEVTPEVEQIVATMLSKDPEHRYASAGELLVALHQVQGLTPVTPPPRPALPSRRTDGFRRVILALALLVTAGGIAGYLTWRPWRRNPPAPPPTFRRLTDYPGKENSPSLSPDGKTFVYARSVDGVSHIFFQRVDGGNPIDLTAGSRFDDIEPAYSPQGDQIVFRSEREGGGIFLMGATGESVRRLSSFGYNPEWSPDGQQIAVATEDSYDPSSRVSESQIFCLDVNRGTKRSLAVPDGVHPSWSPHGLRIAYWGVERTTRRRIIWTMPASGGKPVKVIEEPFFNWNPVWSPDGRSLYFASDRGGSMNLWRMAIDESSGEVLGDPQPITTPSEWSALPSFSRDGSRMLYAGNDNVSFVEQVAVDPERGKPLGPPRVIFQGARVIPGCDLSPDGQWVVYQTSSPEDLLVSRLDGSERRQLTNDRFFNRAPRWSPDGHRIVWYSNRSGKYEDWTVRPDGSELAQVTHLPENGPYNPAWSPDGRQIGFTYGRHGAAILGLSKPDGSLQILPPTVDGQVLARVSWSGDGRFLAGQLQNPDESVDPGIVVWSFADRSYRHLTRSGSHPTFFHRSPQVLFVERGSLRLVDVLSGAVRTLLPAPPHSYYMSASSSADDRTMCTARMTDEGDVWLLSLAGPAGRP